MNDIPTLGQALIHLLRGGNPMDLLLHPEQAALGWGSTFAVFGGLDLPEPEHRFIVYGEVATQAGLIAQLRSQGVDPYDRAKLVAKYDAVIARHELPALGYSVHRPEGWPDVVHAAVVWPIPREVFQSASAAGFDFERFDPGTKAHLGIACAAWRTHQLATGGGL